MDRPKCSILGLIIEQNTPFEWTITTRQAEVNKIVRPAHYTMSSIVTKIPVGLVFRAQVIPTHNRKPLFEHSFVN